MGRHLPQAAGGRGPGRDRPPAPGTGTRWRVAAVWLAGVQAAVALGAVAPVGPAVQSSLGVTLGTVALVTSGTTAVGAVLGVPVGRWLRAFAARDALVLGLLVIAAASVAGAFCGGWPALLGSRVVEGAGFLLVLVAGPTALARQFGGRARAAALAAWGTCVPTGIALAGAAGGALAPVLAWHRWLAVTGAGPLVAAGVLLAVLPRVPGSPTGRLPPSPGALGRAFAPAGAYACLSLIGVAVLVLLPAFLAGAGRLTGTAAGSATAGVSLCSAVGGLVAGRLLRRGTAVRALVPLAVLMPLGCVPAFAPGLSPVLTVGAAALVLFTDGLLISAVFALVPLTTRRGDDVDLVNGALAQFGSLGILVGPPAFGLAVDHAGWRVTGVATALVTAPAVALLLRTVRSARPAPPPTAPAADRVAGAGADADAGAGRAGGGRQADGGHEPRRTR